MSKTDQQLKQHVEEELRNDPKVNAAQIGVSVEGGAVSLLGAVDTFAEKWAAEEATKRVSGVRSFAQDLTVKLLTEHKRSDADIAAAVESVLRWDVFVPKGVTARVERGAVTLSGQATWNYQRESADRAIRTLQGVVSVSNEISLKSETSALTLKENLETTLRRHATTEAKAIHVDTIGSKVTLTGDVSSWRSIDDAVSAVWGTPGVTELDNKLKLSALS